MDEEEAVAIGQFLKVIHTPLPTRIRVVGIESDYILQFILIVKNISVVAEGRNTEE